MAGRRWTLLFIGDHGSVIKLKRFKGMVLSTAFMLIVAIFGIVALILFNQNTIRENKRLRHDLENYQNQLETLRHDKEVLMARLVLTESQVKENLPGTPKRQDDKKDAQPEEQKPQEKPQSKETKIKKRLPLTPKTPEQKPTTAEPKPMQSVAVEKFSASREPDTQSVNAKFNLKNTSPDSQRVEGRAVVVLKSDALHRDKWLVIPPVGLVGEKPSGKRGKSFAIQRFRTMIFTSNAPSYADQFQTAAVYVFTKSGQLLLKRDFPVNISPLAASSPEPASTDDLLKSLKSTAPIY